MKNLIYIFVLAASQIAFSAPLTKDRILDNIEVESDCQEYWYDDFNEEYADAIMTGMQCLNRFDTKYTRFNQKKINKLFSEKKKLKITCSEKLPKGSIAHGDFSKKTISISQRYGSYTSQTKTRGPLSFWTAADMFMMGISGTSYFSEKKSRPFMTKIFFHETFHLLDANYNHGDEVAQDFTVACDTCCFPDEKLKQSEVDYACKACSEKVDIFTPEYVKLISRHTPYLETYFNVALRENKDFACNLEQLFDDQIGSKKYFFRAWMRNNLHKLQGCTPQNPIIEVPEENDHLSNKNKYLLDIALRINKQNTPQLQSVQRQKDHLKLVEYVVRNIAYPDQRHKPVMVNGIKEYKWVETEPNCQVFRDERCMYRNEMRTLELVSYLTHLFVENSNLAEDELEEHLRIIKGHLHKLKSDYLRFADDALYKTKQTRNYQGSAEDNRARLLSLAAQIEDFEDQIKLVNLDRPAREKLKIRYFNFDDLPPIIEETKDQIKEER